MSILGKFFGEAAGETAKGLMEGIGSLATSIRGAITGELPPDARAELERLAVQADQLAMQGQVAINLQEAKSNRLFVAGWRPFIGWVCGLALCWHFLLHPMVIWYMSIWRADLDLPPALDLSQLYPVIIGMLGLGVFRTYEKSKAVQANH
jgi:hypothetical protein